MPLNSVVPCHFVCASKKNPASASPPLPAGHLNRDAAPISQPALSQTAQTQLPSAVLTHQVLQYPAGHPLDLLECVQLSLPSVPQPRVSAPDVVSQALHRGNNYLPPPAT